MGPLTTDRSAACQIGESRSEYPIQRKADGVGEIRAAQVRDPPLCDPENLKAKESNMPSNLETLVTVFGGSGFLGRNVVRALAKRDYRIRVAVRRPELAGHLQPLGRVGQIHAVQANVRYPASVEAAMRDSHVAINLVGILAASGAQTFDAVQARGAEAIAKAAAATGASMVHVSAIGANERSSSQYARSKAAGEKGVLAALPSATIMRPSVVFGPEDQFTNRLAALARLSPALPLIGGGTTRMQPVYVGDVATAIADAVDGKARAGATYELGGPEVLTMREIIETIQEITDRDRMLVSLPFGLAKLQSLFLQFAPGALKLTPDQVELLRSDNIVSQAAKTAGLTLEGLGITPDSLEAVAPQYLWRFRPAGQFQRKDA
jgi:NADH dehydrogenase